MRLQACRLGVLAGRHVGAVLRHVRLAGPPDRRHLYVRDLAVGRQVGEALFHTGRELAAAGLHVAADRLDVLGAGLGQERRRGMGAGGREQQRRGNDGDGYQRFHPGFTRQEFRFEPQSLSFRGFEGVMESQFFSGGKEKGLSITPPPGPIELQKMRVSELGTQARFAIRLAARREPRVYKSVASAAPICGTNCGTASLAM